MERHWLWFFTVMTMRRSVGNFDELICKFWGCFLKCFGKRIGLCEKDYTAFWDGLKLLAPQKAFEHEHSFFSS